MHGCSREEAPCWARMVGAVLRFCQRERHARAPLIGVDRLANGADWLTLAHIGSDWLCVAG